MKKLTFLFLFAIVFFAKAQLVENQSGTLTTSDNIEVVAAQSGQVKIHLTNTNLSGYSVLRFGDQSTGNGKAFLHRFNSNYSSSTLMWEPNSVAFYESVGSMILGAASDFKIFTGNANSERLRVNSIGNVGVGLINPESNLSINKDLSFGKYKASVPAHLTIYDNSTNPQIPNLIAGSAGGTLIEASGYGQLVMGIRDNGVNDGFHIISTSQGYVGQQNGLAAPYNKLVASFLANGNVGIGTNTPSNRLEIYRNTGNETIAQFRTNEGIINIAAAGSSTENPTYGNYISSRNANNTTYEDFGFKTSSGIPQLLIKTNGSVGIGTNNTGTHKLSVNGSIRSKEVKVEANWSDFVFYDNYELRTLEEVEEHIAKNGHLPEIPSEAEVTENGINLGEMDAKLLQKIEELTLYMIDMNRQVQQLKSENMELKEKVQSLENE